MIYSLPVVRIFYFHKDLLIVFVEGTLGAAQKLCANLGCEVVETLVIIELIGFNGRAKLNSVEHFTTLFQFSEGDLEAIAANADRMHESNHA